MVERQIIGRGITDKHVIDAMLEVPRHEFVPEPFRGGSYEDHPLPIGEGQTISQPYMVAIMTSRLELKGGEKILEIGTGSGYQAAVLSKIAAKVYTVERIEKLAGQSRDIFNRLGYNNISVIVGDGSLGYNDESPYDGIIVTCAAPGIPEVYIDQLKCDGRLVIPSGDRMVQELKVITKKKSGVSEQNMGGCVFVPLIGRYGWEK